MTNWFHRLFKSLNNQVPLIPSWSVPGISQFEVLEYHQNEYSVDLLNHTFMVLSLIDGEVDIASLKGIDNAMTKDNAIAPCSISTNGWPKKVTDVNDS